MAEDTLTAQQLDAARRHFAEEDARIAAENAVAAVKRMDDRKAGLAALREILATRQYAATRDKILALAPLFEGDATFGFYANFPAFEEWARTAN